MEQIQDLIDGFIDFEGQRFSEDLLTKLLELTGLLAFVIGFFFQNALYTLYIALGGSAITLLLVVPPWPWYNKNQLKWLPVGSTGEEVEVKKTK